MKITRFKKANKRINFYINNFGYRAPIQILIDGTFCFAAFKNKFKIEDQVKNYLQLEVRLLTTPCLIIEAEKLGTKMTAVTKKLKELTLNKCGHEKSPLPGSECIKELCKKSHYVIATQDRDLQEWIRKQCGIALMYLHQIVPVLEEPSDRSRRFVESRSKSGVTQLEEEKLEYFKKKEGLVKDQKPIVKKKKKKGGPNPLSMKKKSKGSSDTNLRKVKENPINKQKRKRVKIPKHVKELLKSKSE